MSFIHLDLNLMGPNGNTCFDSRPAMEKQSEETEGPAGLLKHLSAVNASNMDCNNNTDSNINNNKFTELGVLTRGSISKNDKLEIKIVMHKVQVCF